MSMLAGRTELHAKETALGIPRVRFSVLGSGEHSCCDQGSQTTSASQNPIMHEQERCKVSDVTLMHYNSSNASGMRNLG